jgi:hypothetical protein
MSPDDHQTKPTAPEFDFSRYPSDSLFHDRRTGRDRRDREGTADGDVRTPRTAETSERRQKKERRRRIDPTTFEKQYRTRTTAYLGLARLATPRCRRGLGLPSIDAISSLTFPGGRSALVRI